MLIVVMLLLTAGTFAFVLPPLFERDRTPGDRARR